MLFGHTVTLHSVNCLGLRSSVGLCRDVSSLSVVSTQLNTHLLVSPLSDRQFPGRQKFHVFTRWAVCGAQKDNKQKKQEADPSQKNKWKSRCTLISSDGERNTWAGCFQQDYGISHVQLCAVQCTGSLWSRHKQAVTSVNAPPLSCRGIFFSSCVTFTVSLTLTLNNRSLFSAMKRLYVSHRQCGASLEGTGDVEVAWIENNIIMLMINMVFWPK